MKNTIKQILSKTKSELYQEERNKYKIGSYGEVLQKCANYIDAIKMFRDLAEKTKKECEMWQNKVYRENKKVVYGNMDDVHEYLTTIGEVNEKRKQTTINRLNEQSKEYLNYINILKERINIE